MADHKKPTKEELEQQRLAALKKLEEDNPPSPSPSETPPSPSPSEEIPSPSPSEEIPSPSPSEEVPSPSPSAPAPSPDYKKKFKASTQEALVQAAKNKKIQEAVEAAGGLPEPTDDELRAEYPEYDEMSDFEKKLVKDNMRNNRRFDVIHKASQEGKDIEKWDNDVKEFIEDPKTLSDNPDLEGKQDDFRVFATKPTRRGVPFEDLVAAFLYDVSKNAKPKNKGKMFETPKGGPSDRGKPRDGKLSVMDSRALMKTDYKKYVRLLKEGKISLE